MLGGDARCRYHYGSNLLPPPKKEVMFSVRSVCLSVCLLRHVSQKVSLIVVPFCLLRHVVAVVRIAAAIISL